MVLNMVPYHAAKTLYLTADILISQTGTGNFAAWYCTQRKAIQDQIQEDSKLFSLDEVSEIHGGDVDYVINIQRDGRHSTTLIESPSNTAFSNNKSAGGQSRSAISIFSSMTKRRSNRVSSGNSDDIDSEYEPPNVDVMAMEPVMKLSDVSFNVDMDNMPFNMESSNMDMSKSNIFNDSPTAMRQPSNMQQHIMNSYGNGYENGMNGASSDNSDSHQASRSSSSGSSTPDESF